MGDTPTASVRRFTSHLGRQGGLVNQIFFRCAPGRAAERKDVVAGGGNCLLRVRPPAARLAAMVPNCSSTLATSG